MARASTRAAAALVVLAALPALAACALPEPSTASTSGRLPSFGWAPWSRGMQAPADEPPAWLPPSPPTDLPRFPAPSDGFRA